MNVAYTQRLRGRAEALDALEALAYRTAQQLRRRRFPPLYSSGVVYKTSRRLRRHWQTAREVLERGHGDCADLAAWRVAELRARGVPARFRLRSTRQPGLYHVLVVVDGKEDDPSRRLGMKG